MIVEAILAFVLILASAGIIYMLGRRSAPKTSENAGAVEPYACGERAHFRGLKINVNLYRYLIYFVILDSSVLLLAFGSFSVTATNPLFLIIYLGIILAAGLVLLDGGKE